MGQRLGSLISAVGGLVFVLVNAGGLPDPLGLAVALTGVAVFVAAVWYSVERTRSWPRGPAPLPRSMRVYWACVAAEVVAIPVGALVLREVVRRPVLTPVWVVFVVGVHFLPFASAFGVPLFGALGVSMMVVAVVGAVAAWNVGAVGAAAAGVAAGALLLAFAVIGSVWERSRLRS